MKEIPVIVYKKPQKKSNFKKPQPSGINISGAKSSTLSNIKVDVYKLLARNAVSIANAQNSRGQNSQNVSDAARASRETLAISLGAKPASKRPYVNYKQLQADIKKQKEVEQPQQSSNLLLRFGGSSIQKKSESRGRDSHRRGEDTGLCLGGGVRLGKWMKSGMLHLSKDDVAQIKSSKTWKF